MNCSTQGPGNLWNSNILPNLAQDADLESQLAHVVASLTGTLAAQSGFRAHTQVVRTAEPRTSRRGNFGASAATYGESQDRVAVKVISSFITKIYEDHKFYIVECDHVRELNDLIFWRHLSIRVCRG